MGRYTYLAGLVAASLLTASCASRSSDPFGNIDVVEENGKVLFDPTSPCQNFRELPEPGPNRYKFSFTGSARVGDVVECSYYLRREVLQIVSVSATNPVNSNWKMLGDKRTLYGQFGFSGSGGSANTQFTLDVLLSSTAPPPSPPRPPKPPPIPPKPLKDCVWLLGSDEGWMLAPLTTTGGCSRLPLYTVLVSWGGPRIAYSLDSRPRPLKTRGSSAPTIVDVTPIRSGLGQPVDPALVSCVVDERTYLCKNQSTRWVHLAYEISPDHDGIVFHELLAPGARLVHPHFPPQVAFKPLRLEYEQE